MLSSNPYSFGFDITAIESCDFETLEPISNESILKKGREGQNDERLLGFITKKMGIQNRYYAPASLDALDIARQALKKLITKNPNLRKETDFLIFACISNPMPTTCMSSFLASENEIEFPSCFDLKSGCSSGVLALQMALDYFNKGARKGIIVCSETLSKFAHPEFLQMSAATGDGAVALSIERSDERKILGLVHGTDPSLMKSMFVPGKFPIKKDDYKSEDYFFHFSGKADTIEKIGMYWQKSLVELLETSQVEGADINHYIAHQVDGSKNKAFAKAENIPDSSIASNFANYGNMGCPTIFLNYKAWLDTGHEVKNKEKMIFHAVGGGVSWAGICMEVL